MVSPKSVDSLSRPDSFSSPLRQSVASEPLFWNAYVVICLSLPRPLTFTETTFKQTLGRLFLDVSTGADSLKVHDTVTGWATKLSLTKEPCLLEVMDDALVVPTVVQVVGRFITKLA